MWIVLDAMGRELAFTVAHVAGAPVLSILDARVVTVGEKLTAQTVNFIYEKPTLESVFLCI